ncbi:TetR family transcriptional regulator [Promicromonospora sp. AC04]|uniref:TetR/AcrR family transcriptional regulator n=1 Tax=Promicromonospora sp. AC04 TaxID=2135723 RepID=UPI000D3B579D|nr:TetR family transcriptional regulator [Promicromonospora sp. AC04]PUB26281.1 TetR family transcriptional regulator [Promicromonospora sp. AC04]
MSGRDDVPGKRRAAQGTRERLIEAAVRLFGERGIEATSLRALTEAARSNIAAVNYHFGSKEGLLRAVVDRTMRLANNERSRRLDELESAPEPPTVAALVRAFVEPGADLLEGHGPDVARFIGRMISEPDPRVRQLFADQVDPVEGRYLAALSRALPEVDDDGIRFAYTSMLGLLSLHQSGAFATVEWPQLRGPASGTGRSDDADRERLVAFVTAGMLAAHPR